MATVTMTTSINTMNKQGDNDNKSVKGNKSTAPVR